MTPESSPLFIGMLLIGLGQIATIIVNIRKASGQAEKREISPNPLEVKQAVSFISRDLYEQMHRAQDSRIVALESNQVRLQEQIMADIKSLMKADEIRASGLHSRINTLLASFSQLSGEVQQFMKQKGRA